MKTHTWRAVIELSNLESSTKLLLYTMANYMNEHGDWCYPSVKKLAKGCGVDESTIFRHLKKAEIAGFIEKRKRRITGQEWASNEYKAVMPNLELSDLESEDPTHAKERAGIMQALAQKQPRDGILPVEGSHNASEGVAYCNTNYPYELSNELKEKDKKEKPLFVLPDFIPAEDWEGYLEMRKKKKNSPFTDHAKKLIVKDLVKLHEAGEDIAAVLQNSTKGGWAGVYPVNKQGGNRPKAIHKDFQKQNYSDTGGFHVPE